MDCQTCQAKGTDPCMTSGGYVAQLPHSPRVKLGFTHAMQLLHLDKQAAGRQPTSPMEEIKLASWFVITIGGVEKARKAVEAIAQALETLKREL